MPNGAAALFQKQQYQIARFKKGFIILIAGILKAHRGIGINSFLPPQVINIVPGFIVSLQRIQAFDNLHSRMLHCLVSSVGADILRRPLYWHSIGRFTKGRCCRSAAEAGQNGDYRQKNCKQPFHCRPSFLIQYPATPSAPLSVSATKKPFPLL